MLNQLSYDELFENNFVQLYTSLIVLYCHKPLYLKKMNYNFYFRTSEFFYLVLLYKNQITLKWQNSETYY